MINKRAERLLEPLMCLSHNLRNSYSISPAGESDFRGNGRTNSVSIRADSRGSVLLIALWSLCLLTVFAVYLGYGVRQKITLIERLNSRDNLHFIADAGLKQAIAELRREDRTEYDALNETWSDNPVLFQQVNIGHGEFSVCYNYPNFYSGFEETRYGLVDEERKLNLNTAGLDEIQRLITIVADFDETDAHRLAAAIVDWRDSDNKLSIPLGSAEDRYYRNLSNPYEAKDAEFEVFEELLLVRWMSQEVLDKLKNYITIYSNGNINLNTAPGQILLALNLTDELVDKIVSFRSGEDEIEATSDDNIFSSPSNIVTELSQFYELSDPEIASLSNLVSTGKISTGSSTFMVRSIAQLYKRELQIICVVNREGQILSWNEG